MPATTNRHTLAVEPHQHNEGTMTKAIEQYTTQIPSGTFLTLAGGSVGIAALLYLAGRKDAAHFVGHWVPTILLLGLYNKMVKLHGSE
jgi:hypothetical protein